MGAGRAHPLAQQQELLGDARRQLVSLGRYAMKGVAQPQELFTLDRG